MNVRYEFVGFGTRCASLPGRLVLDVGMAQAPGILDHHFPEAENECAASLVVKHPELVLDHLRPAGRPADAFEPITIVTHTLPDFDALAAIFLSLRLLEIGRVDEGMRRLASYTRTVDASMLPPTIDLAATPYAVLRALFAGAKKPLDEINADRVDEGLKFMKLLHSRAEQGRDILEARDLFSGIDRYERAVRKVEGDNAWYQGDSHHGRKIMLNLPNAGGSGRTLVDGLVVVNAHSFLLKEWARRDRDGSPLGRGFSFVYSNFQGLRHSLGVDPAAGVNLHGLADVLNSLESRKAADMGQPDRLRWYGGECPFFNYRLVVSPHDGTRLSHEEIFSTVMRFGAASASAS
ncbi:MAG: hypothetical protein JW843_00340 [Candidatus Aminicenantes bacterium]|nr:hypothetical protein [Candidatus Aminicenantes bacterium]